MNHRYTPYIAIIAAIAQVAMWTTATFRGPAEVGIPLLIVSTAGLAWLCGLAIADLENRWAEARDHRARMSQRYGDVIKAAGVRLRDVAFVLPDIEINVAREPDVTWSLDDLDPPSPTVTTLTLTRTPSYVIGLRDGTRVHYVPGV